MYTGRPPKDSLPGGYRQAHRRAGSSLMRGSDLNGVDWPRLAAYVLGISSFLLFFGFLSRGGSIASVKQENERLNGDVQHLLRESNNLRSTVSQLEQELTLKEQATTSLRAELNQFRDQSSRLDSMLEGYRGQLNRLEHKLSQTERDCKSREEDLEADIAKAMSDLHASEKNWEDEKLVSSSLTRRVGDLERDLKYTQDNLQACKSGGVEKDNTVGRGQANNANSGVNSNVNSNSEVNSGQNGASDNRDGQNSIQDDLGRRAGAKEEDGGLAKETGGAQPHESHHRMELNQGGNDGGL